MSFFAKTLAVMPQDAEGLDNLSHMCGKISDSFEEISGVADKLKNDIEGRVRLKYSGERETAKFQLIESVIDAICEIREFFEIIGWDNDLDEAVTKNYSLKSKMKVLELLGDKVGLAVVSTICNGISDNSREISGISSMLSRNISGKPKLSSDKKRDNLENELLKLLAYMLELTRTLFYNIGADYIKLDYTIKEIRELKWERLHKSERKSGGGKEGTS